MKILAKKVGSDGYTIIEVMIFLAVSGFMFILAAVFINGKQAQVAFQQGMQAAASTMTNAINTVANGEYQPLPSDVQCVSPGGSHPHFQPNPSGDTTQGANYGCIFMGKVMQFGTNSDGTAYQTFTIAGRQYTSLAGSLPQPVQTFADALPVAVTSGNSGNRVDLTQTGTLEQGLAAYVPNGQTSSVFLCSGNCNGSTSASDPNMKQGVNYVGFFGSFGSYNSGVAASQSSGAQNVVVATIPSLPDGTGRTSGEILPLTTGNYIVLCFANGNRIGSVTIGGTSGQQTAVSVDYNEDSPC